MTKPRHRSRSMRRKQKKTPGGTTGQTYLARKPGLHKCAECGAELKGIPRLKPSKAANKARSAKRPERPYGGFLCSRCARQKIKQEARL